ncbi:TIGR00645 family protein [Pigmentibacter sp. JX0631]|uniref:TIGR00645 family protein n=1 Tax=Pigmentibacter sp. JX0631 TaxID=2976982 RepID=UPI0024685CCF|nr:TIGR00645 family protein [Pigmentibacter sp. JX0631]WGL59618.1 TIGR00645 family protein [Pigmentibacter sp. JX0631]
MSSSKKDNIKLKIETTLEYIIFASRWLQAPLYFGLIIAQIAYTIKFIQELVHIIGSATVSTELQLLLGILSLVDFTMVANLLAMVIIGGYATFVSKLNVENHDDKPDWLDHIDPGTIKVKLASSLIGISSIHLLRSFIDISVADIEKIKWQIIIHLTFIASTVFLAISEYIMSKKHSHQTH